MVLVVSACAIGCTSIVVPVNYNAIQGDVGGEMTAGAAPPCASPTVLVVARINEGDLPPGLVLAPEGGIHGKPLEAGHWHVMLRSARLQCQDGVRADTWQTLHFQIAARAVADTKK
jgi:hypothetical protein